MNVVQVTGKIYIKVFEIWKIGVVNNPRKWLNVYLVYINNLNKTMEQNNKAPKKVRSQKVKVYSFSVYKYFLCLKFWKCLENLANNIFYHF